MGVCALMPRALHIPHDNYAVIWIWGVRERQTAGLSVSLLARQAAFQLTSAPFKTDQQSSVCS